LILYPLPYRKGVRDPLLPLWRDPYPPFPIPYFDPIKGVLCCVQIFSWKKMGIEMNPFFKRVGILKNFSRKKMSLKILGFSKNNNYILTKQII
jgi:hypothetical protein